MYSAGNGMAHATRGKRAHKAFIEESPAPPNKPIVMTVGCRSHDRSRHSAIQTGHLIRFAPRSTAVATPPDHKARVPHGECRPVNCLETYSYLPIG